MEAITPFETRAAILIDRGIPVAPIPAGTKAAKLSNWENLATTDPTKIAEWGNNGYADGNTAAVAKARDGGVFFLEIDKPNFHKEIQLRAGQTIPSTFMVSSRPGEGRGHFYFRHTPETIALAEKIGKAYLSGKQDGKEAWSLRWNNSYVVGPFSIHPETKKLYEIRKNVDIAPGPTWLVQWCVDNQGTPKEKVLEGGRDNWLISQLGKARQTEKLEYDALLERGHQLNQEFCMPPLTDREVEKTARSAASYEIVPEVPVILHAPEIKRSILKIEGLPHPEFPIWVMKGTSIGDGLVDPILEKNNSYAQYIFMPAMIMMLNYLGLKVEIKDIDLIPSVYMVSVGAAEKTFKSSGVKQAARYLGAIGVVDYGSGSKAEGKSLIWTPASTEGLGQEMALTSCKNAILFYDELSLIVKKASIDGSSMMEHLLAIYESAMFANLKSSRRERFSHAADSYCGSLITCCPTATFSRVWAKIPDSSDSGWGSRFFFIYQPEVLHDEYRLEFKVDTRVNAPKTYERLQKAMKQKVYEISNIIMLEEEIKKLGSAGPRYAKLVQKFALYFAVDLGRDEIDEGCIERAVALVRYGIAVKAYLRTYESESKQSAIQQSIIDTLLKHNGTMTVRELKRVLHPVRLGLDYWNKAYRGLIIDKYIQEDGDGTKGDSLQLILLKGGDE